MRYCLCKIRRKQSSIISCGMKFSQEFDSAGFRFSNLEEKEFCEFGFGTLPLSIIFSRISCTVLESNNTGSHNYGRFRYSFNQFH